MSALRVPSVPVVIGLLVVFLAAPLAVLRPAEAAVVPPWFSENAIVNVPPAYSGSQPSIAVGPSGVVYLAYVGWGGPTTQQDIFFSKSGDGAWSWTTPMRVNNDAGGAFQSRPSLFLDASEDIYLVWTDTRGGNSDIYFSLSTDGGLSFSANVRVNDVTGNAQVNADIAVDSLGLVHAVWEDNRNALTTGPDIYYANSTDGGLSFNPSARVNNDATSVEQARPAIAVASDRSVYVVWDDPRNGGRGRDIYFSESSDLGGTWNPNLIVNDDTGGAVQDSAAIAVDASDIIYVVWSDSRTAATSPDIFAARSSNGGSTFTANVRVNDDVGATWQSSASLSANAGTIQVVWADTRTVGATGFDVYTASSADGASWAENLRVNDDAIVGNDQVAPTVAVGPAGDVFAAWTDERVSGMDVFAAVLDVHLPTAVASGNATISQGAVASFSASGSMDNLGLVAWEWNFGDGAQATGATATHTYPRPGTYTVTLTVRDRSGNADTETLSIAVLDTEAPTARGGGDRSADEGQPIFFDAGASTDNVGVASYAWDFGDGTSSTDAAATHEYATPGMYDVTLTVRDAAGNTDTVTMSVEVRAVSPKVSDLLGAIQSLWAAILVLGILLVIVAIITFDTYRRTRAKKAPMEASPQGSHDVHPPPPPPG